MLSGHVRNANGTTLRLLHYWWPLALGWSLTSVVQRATGDALDPRGVQALLAGIVAAYSLDRVIDPAGRVADSSGAAGQALFGRLSLRRSSDSLLPVLLSAMGVLAALVCLWEAWHLPVQTAALMPLLGVAALAYPRLKRLPLTKTLALPLVWTWASIALPLADGSWFGWRALREPIAAPLFLLIAAGCLLCDLKDEIADRASGVRSLPALLGRDATIVIAAGLTVAAGVVAVVEHRTGIAISAAVLGVSTAWPTLLATESAGPLLVDMILTLPGLLIAARLV